MCGRYASTRSPHDLAPLFQVPDVPAKETLAPNWNAAPTNDVWAVLERSPRGEDDTGTVQRELRPLRWGLVPSWAKDVKIGARMINARVETVHEKPAYRRAFIRRRCLLPADGFYEWEQITDPATGKARKQPYFIHPEDEQVMALAGLYEYWRDPAVKQDDDPAAWLMTCTILTTEATDAAGRVHPRMPLALTPDHYDAWLDPAHQDPDELRALLGQPAEGTCMPGPSPPPSTTSATTGPTSSTNSPRDACRLSRAAREGLVRADNERVGAGVARWTQAGSVVSPRSSQPHFGLQRARSGEKRSSET